MPSSSPPVILMSGARDPLTRNRDLIKPVHRANREAQTMNAAKPSRRGMLASAGAIFMGQSMRRTAAAEAPWVFVSPNEAGFTSDLEARLDEAITEERV